MTHPHIINLCFRPIIYLKTLKCHLTVEECPWCQGIWLDNSKLNESHEKARYTIIEYEDSKDSSMKDRIIITIKRNLLKMVL